MDGPFPVRLSKVRLVSGEAPNDTSHPVRADFARGTGRKLTNIRSPAFHGRSRSPPSAPPFHRPLLLLDLSGYSRRSDRRSLLRQRPCLASATCLAPSAAAAVRVPGGGAVLLSRIAAADGAVSRGGREGTANTHQGWPILHVSSGGPSRSKTPSPLPTVARVQRMTPMSSSPPVTAKKPAVASRLSDAEVAALTARG